MIDSGNTPARRSPMTPEARALAGDPNHVAMARRMAARMTAKSTNVRFVDPDELRSAAMEGLCDAATRFDPAKGARFATFARHRIRGAILDQVRASRGGSRGGPSPWLLSLDQPCVNSNRNGSDRDIILLSETIASGDESVGSGAEAIDAVDDLIRRLPGRNRRAMRLIYAEAIGGNLTKAAQAMGLSLSRVAQLHAQSLEMIREHMKSHSRTSPVDRLALRRAAEAEEAVAATLARSVPANAATKSPGCPSGTGSRKSAYRGVCWHKNTERWRVVVCTAFGQKHVGEFADEREAARAYDGAAAYFKGAEARLNFPDETPLIPPELARQGPYRGGPVAVPVPPVATSNMPGARPIRDGVFHVEPSGRSDGPEAPPEAIPGFPAIGPTAAPPSKGGTSRESPGSTRVVIAPPATRPAPDPDPEIAAMVAVSSALKGLDPGECRRVLHWASSRYYDLQPGEFR